MEGCSTQLLTEEKKLMWESILENSLSYAGPNRPAGLSLSEMQTVSCFPSSIDSRSSHIDKYVPDLYPNLCSRGADIKEV